DITLKMLSTNQEVFVEKKRFEQREIEIIEGQVDEDVILQEYSIGISKGLSDYLKRSADPRMIKACGINPMDEKQTVKIAKAKRYLEIKLGCELEKLDEMLFG
ncbi:hypothetical protein N8668_02190, partial [bacterium]|nr:hypothetical protein [bacterium]